MGTIQKKISMMSLLLLVASYAWSQVGAERRVYYLDATYSMISPSKLWDPVRKDLGKAINAIEDENTEIYVVAFGGNKGAELKTWHGYANSVDKQAIINGFMSFDPQSNTMTYLDRPLQDFYDSKADPRRVTYCFLMTDGIDENCDKECFANILKQWGRRYSNTDVYGFYVMLNNEARDPRIETIINDQDNLWVWETADVNVNIVRLERSVKFNVRNDDSISIPISGNVNGLKFTASFPDDANIKVKKTYIEGGKLILDIQILGNISTMPESSHINLDVKMSGGGKLDKFVTEAIDVECLNKHERVLSTPVGNQKLGKVSHYDKYWFVSGRTVPVSYHFDCVFNNDAKANPNTFAEFAFVDNKGLPVSADEMQVKVNGEILDRNVFKVTPESGSIEFEIEFPTGAARGKHQGNLKLVNHNLHRLNNDDCEGMSANAFKWTVYNDYDMNPLRKAFIGVGFLLASFLALWFCILKPLRYPRFPKFRKSVLIRRNGKVIASFNVDFKGARKVVFANHKQKQSVLCRIFTGEIRTIVNPVFEDSITFIPRRGKKAVGRGLGYSFKSNPIPQSGVTEILSPSRNLIINLQ